MGAVGSYVSRACAGSARQRRARAGCCVSPRRSPLRCDCPAMLGLMARRRTHYAHCVRCVQTAAPSQMTKRAARAATSPALLGASEALRSLPGRAFAGPWRGFVGTRNRWCSRQAVLRAGAVCGGEKRRPGVGARSALRHLTRRPCLSAVSAANVASWATRHRAEHRSAVAAKRRPPQSARARGTACRDARRWAHGRRSFVPASTPAISSHRQRGFACRDRLIAAEQRA